MAEYNGFNKLKIEDDTFTIGNLPIDAIDDEVLTLDNFGTKAIYVGPNQNEGYFEWANIQVEDYQTRNWSYCNIVLQFWRGQRAPAGFLTFIVRYNGNGGFSVGPSFLFIGDRSVWPYTGEIKCFYDKTNHRFSFWLYKTDWCAMDIKIIQYSSSLNFHINTQEEATASFGNMPEASDTIDEIRLYDGPYVSSTTLMIK